MKFRPLHDRVVVKRIDARAAYCLTAYQGKASFCCRARRQVAARPLNFRRVSVCETEGVGQAHFLNIYCGSRGY